MLSDSQIRDQYPGIIDPFIPHQVSNVMGRRVISYGLTTVGYDIRCSNKFALFNGSDVVVDPKNFDPA